MRGRKRTRKPSRRKPQPSPVYEMRNWWGTYCRHLTNPAWREYCMFLLDYRDALLGRPKSALNFAGTSSVIRDLYRVYDYGRYQGQPTPAREAV